MNKGNESGKKDIQIVKHGSFPGRAKDLSLFNDFVQFWSRA
jgi:hypothetical protein